MSTFRMDMRRFALAAVALAACVSASAATGARKPKLPAPATGWRDACRIAPGLPGQVKEALLRGKNLKTSPFRLMGHQYRHRAENAASYGQVMCRFYMDNVLKSKSVADIEKMVKAASAKAAEFRAANKPLLAEAEKAEIGLEAVWRSLARNPSKAEALKETAFEGGGSDELSHAMKKLSAAIAEGDDAAAARWAGEAHGAAARLADLLRWVDLQTEWWGDLATVFMKFDMCFKNSDTELAKIGGWKNFMFGRAPGAQSMQMLAYKDGLMVEHLLCDFFTVTDKDAAAMGALEAKETHFAINPSRRDAYKRLASALPAKAKKAFADIPATKFELSAFNSSIWRHEDEGCLDDLATSLKRHAARYRATSVRQLMEIIHVDQGAWGATGSAKDRYHPKVKEYAAQVKGTPDLAAKQAHDLAYSFYTTGGRANYRGRIWTLHDMLKGGSGDCIRISQLIGCIYANAGYCGVLPVRIGRGNVRLKMLATSGHTFVDFDFGAADRCSDGLKKRDFLKPYAQMHTGDRKVLSCARGRRSLMSFVTGEIYFPQGPIKAVQLRMPHYGMERKGFE